MLLCIPGGRLHPTRGRDARRMDLRYAQRSSSRPPKGSDSDRRNTQSHHDCRTPQMLCVGKSVPTRLVPTSRFQPASAREFGKEQIGGQTLRRLWGVIAADVLFPNDPSLKSTSADLLRPWARVFRTCHKPTVRLLGFQVSGNAVYQACGMA